MMEPAIGVDVGGTSIKAGIVDLASGTLETEIVSLETPQPATFDAVCDAIATLLDRLDPGRSRALPLGIGLPISVLSDGSISGVGLHAQWHGIPALGLLEQRFGPCSSRNDADSAALAELYFGAAYGRSGTVLVLTLGTGIGSALLVGGHLVPNLEFGILPWRGSTAESRLSAVSRERLGLGWKEWAAEFSLYLDLLNELVSPELIIIAGGPTEAASRFLDHLRSPVPVQIATFRSGAGIIGAALNVRHDREARSHGDPTAAR